MGDLICSKSEQKKEDNSAVFVCFFLFLQVENKVFFEFLISRL